MRRPVGPVIGVSRVRLLKPHELQPGRLLCPWDFPGKNAGMGCHILLQDLPDPGIKPASPALQGFFTAGHQGSSLVVEILTVQRVVQRPATLASRGCCYQCRLPNPLTPKRVHSRRKYPPSTHTWQILHGISLGNACPRLRAQVPSGTSAPYPSLLAATHPCGDQQGVNCVGTLETTSAFLSHQGWKTGPYCPWREGKRQDQGPWHRDSLTSAPMWVARRR